MNTFFKETGLAVSSGRRLALRAGMGLAAGLALPMGLARAADNTKEISQQIQVANALEHYNHEQWRRVFLTGMYLPHQGKTNTCVLHQVQSAQFALGRPVISAEEFRRVIGSLDNVKLPETFNAIGMPPVEFRARQEDYHPSRYPGYLLPKNPVLGVPYAKLTPEQMVERGVNMGHIVVMAVEASVLHRAFQKKYFPLITDYEPAKDSHAIRVIGLRKSSRNVIESAFIYDSSSPTKETRYEIGFKDLMSAYRGGTFNSWENSSVYITQATVFPPLIESY